MKKTTEKFIRERITECEKTIQDIMMNPKRSRNRYTMIEAVKAERHILQYVLKIEFGEEPKI